jgi:hypothetical protein
VNSPSTAREALLVEMIGEMATLLERLEAVAPLLETNRLALIRAGDELANQVTTVEGRMNRVADNAKVHAIKHIARRTDEMARTSMEAQTRAMEAAARTLFSSELGPALQRVALPVQGLAVLAHRAARPWDRWLTHAATALLAAGLSWGLAAWVWAR